MKRLIKDAAKLDKSIKKNDLSFSNIVKAINVVQTEMGITGTTALEAGATIAGSVGAMKAAWTNLVTGLADGNADIGKLVDNLVTTIVGDGTPSNLGVLGNVLPAVKTALNGASKLVKKLLPKIVREIPSIIKDNLPILAEAAVSIVESLADGISENQEMLMSSVLDAVVYLAKSFVTMLPKIVQLGFDVIISLANGISTSLPELIPTIVDVILQIVETLTSEENLSNLLDAAIEIIDTLADSLLTSDNIDKIIEASVKVLTSICNAIFDNIEKLVDVAVKIILSLVEYLTDEENLVVLLDAAGAIIGALGNAIVATVDGLGSALAEVISFITEEFFGIDLTEEGKHAIQSFLKGLARGLAGVSTQDKYLASILGGAKKDLEKGILHGSHRDGLDYVPFDGYIAELHKGERVLTAAEAKNNSWQTQNVNVTVTIDDGVNAMGFARALLPYLKIAEKEAYVY